MTPNVNKPADTTHPRVVEGNPGAVIKAATEIAEKHPLSSGDFAVAYEQLAKLAAKPIPNKKPGGFWGNISEKIENSFCVRGVKIYYFTAVGDTEKVGKSLNQLGNQLKASLTTFYENFWEPEYWGF